MQIPSKTDVLGIDIYHGNGNVNFTQLKNAGYQFVVAKCTEGTTFHDPMFPTYSQQTKGLLDFGAYHYAHPENNQPKEEAQFFYNTLIQYRKDCGEIMPCLDVEEPATALKNVTGAQIVQWIKDFLSEWKSISGGVPIMIYTSKWFTDEYGIQDKELTQFPLWCADYSKDNFVEDFGGWTQWEMWQTTGSGSVQGVSGECDIDRAVSLNAIRIHPVSTDAINKILSLLGAAYNLSDNAEIKEELHETANDLRVKAGIPIQ